MGYLEQKLIEEMGEYFAERNVRDIGYKELVDMILVSLMIAKRHLMRMGMTRYEKFDQIFEEISNREKNKI